MKEGYLTTKVNPLNKIHKNKSLILLSLLTILTSSVYSDITTNKNRIETISLISGDEITYPVSDLFDQVEIGKPEYSSIPIEYSEIVSFKREQQKQKLENEFGNIHEVKQLSDKRIGILAENNMFLELIGNPSDSSELKEGAFFQIADPTEVECIRMIPHISAGSLFLACIDKKKDLVPVETGNQEELMMKDLKMKQTFKKAMTKVEKYHFKEQKILDLKRVLQEGNSTSDETEQNEDNSSSESSKSPKTEERTIIWIYSCPLSDITSNSKTPPKFEKFKVMLEAAETPQDTGFNFLLINSKKIGSHILLSYNESFQQKSPISDLTIPTYFIHSFKISKEQHKIESSQIFTYNLQQFGIKSTTRLGIQNNSEIYFLGRLTHGDNQYKKIIIHLNSRKNSFHINGIAGVTKLMNNRNFVSLSQDKLIYRSKGEMQSIMVCPTEQQNIDNMKIDFTKSKMFDLDSDISPSCLFYSSKNFKFNPLNDLYLEPIISEGLLVLRSRTLKTSRNEPITRHNTHFMVAYKSNSETNSSESPLVGRGYPFLYGGVFYVIERQELRSYDLISNKLKVVAGEVEIKKQIKVRVEDGTPESKKSSEISLNLEVIDGLNNKIEYIPRMFDIELNFKQDYSTFQQLFDASEIRGNVHSIEISSIQNEEENKKNKKSNFLNNLIVYSTTQKKHILQMEGSNYDELIFNNDKVITFTHPNIIKYFEGCGYSDEIMTSNFQCENYQFDDNNNSSFVHTIKIGKNQYGEIGDSVFNNEISLIEVMISEQINSTVNSSSEQLNQKTKLKSISLIAYGIINAKKMNKNTISGEIAVEGDHAKELVSKIVIYSQKQYFYILCHAQQCKVYVLFLKTKKIDIQLMGIIDSDYFGASQFCPQKIESLNNDPGFMIFSRCQNTTDKTPTLHKIKLYDTSFQQVSSEIIRYSQEFEEVEFCRNCKSLQYMFLYSPKKSTNIEIINTEEYNTIDKNSIDLKNIGFAIILYFQCIDEQILVLGTSIMNPGQLIYAILKKDLRGRFLNKKSMVVEVNNLDKEIQKIDIFRAFKKSDVDKMELLNSKNLQNGDLFLVLYSESGDNEVIMLTSTNGPKIAVFLDNEDNSSYSDISSPIKEVKITKDSRCKKEFTLNVKGFYIEGKNNVMSQKFNIYLKQFMKLQPLDIQEVKIKKKVKLGDNKIISYHKFFKIEEKETSNIILGGYEPYDAKAAVMHGPIIQIMKPIKSAEEEQEEGIDYKNINDAQGSGDLMVSLKKKIGGNSNFETYYFTFFNSKGIIHTFEIAELPREGYVDWEFQRNQKNNISSLLITYKKDKFSDSRIKLVQFDKNWKNIKNNDLEFVDDYYRYGHFITGDKTVIYTMSQGDLRTIEVSFFGLIEMKNKNKNEQSGTESKQMKKFKVSKLKSFTIEARKLVEIVISKNKIYTIAVDDRSQIYVSKYSIAKNKVSKEKRVTMNNKFIEGYQVKNLVCNSINDESKTLDVKCLLLNFDTQTQIYININDNTTGGSYNAEISEFFVPELYSSSKKARSWQIGKALITLKIAENIDENVFNKNGILIWKINDILNSNELPFQMINDSFEYSFYNLIHSLKKEYDEIFKYGGVVENKIGFFNISENEFDINSNYPGIKIVDAKLFNSMERTIFIGGHNNIIKKSSKDLFDEEVIEVKKDMIHEFKNNTVIEIPSGSKNVTTKVDKKEGKKEDDNNEKATNTTSGSSSGSDSISSLHDKSNGFQNNLLIFFVCFGIIFAGILQYYTQKDNLEQIGFEDSKNYKKWEI